MKIDKDDTTEFAHQRQLTLFDTVCIVVGIIIGASIFRAPQLVAIFTGNIGLYFLAWTLGGAISLLGSLCFAELATRYPEHGGAYAYLRRAFGDRAGFFYAWTEFWLVRPGNVGAMALVFAPAFRSALGQTWNDLYVAIGIVVAVTLLNLVGLRIGVWGQNVFTSAKVLGLALVVAIGVGGALLSPQQISPQQTGEQGNAGSVKASPVDSAGMDSPAAPVAPAPPPSLLAQLGSFWQAMIFVMFAYGGWSDMAMVGAEVRDPKRNLFRALLLGAATVTLIYLLVNAAYLLRLGFDGVLASKSPAQVLISGAFGDAAGRVMSGLICISCLGAVQGLIFTGARVQYALGRDHRLFAWLGEWNAGSGVPVRALLAQCGAAVLLLLAAYISVGQEADKAEDGFGQMVNYTGIVYWSSLFAVGLALIVLRKRDVSFANPPMPGFRVPWFPLLSVLFLVCMGLMVYATVQFAVFENLLKGSGKGWFVMALGVLVTGILLGGFSKSAAGRGA